MTRSIKVFGALLVALAALGTARSAEAKTTLKLGTLAPKQSPWGKVFTTWAKAVDVKTKGEVQLTWLWNGIAGPEEGVVSKIKTGQLGGAAITTQGLSSIHKPITALGMPGAFKSWAELDKARETLKAQFDQSMNGEGFVTVGWGDVGTARTFSKGFAVRAPADLRGKTPVLLRGDLIGPKVFEAIGGVTARQAAVTEFLPLLRSGSINVVTAPPLAVEQLQWAPNLDHLNTGVVGFGVGALVVSKKAVDGMTADQRDVFLSSGAQAGKALTSRIRKEDDAAYGRLQKKMKVHSETAAERAEWDKVWKKACERLKGALPGNVLSQVGFC
jgi:TRAP-type transport system periplasmic protein